MAGQSWKFMFNKKDRDLSRPSVPQGDFASLSEEAKELRRLNILLELSKELNSTTNMQTLLTQVVDSAVEITGAERGFMMLLENPVKLDHRLYDPVITPHPHKKASMEFRVARSASKKDLIQENFKISMTVANRVAETGQPAWVRDAQSEQRLKDADSVTNLDLRTILCVPLRQDSIVIGIIYVDSRFIMRTFTEEDLIMFEALAEHASRAISKSRLYEENLQKEKFERENQELRALDRKKSDFINMLAHEFRTPLTVIQGYSERLRAGKISDQQQIAGHASIIHDEAVRLAKLVDELLDLSRVRSGQQQILKRETDLTSVIEKAAETLKPRAQSKQQQLLFVCAKRPILMNLDPDKIFQVVLNLLDNAIKYTHEKGTVQIHADEIPALEVQGDTFVASFAQVTVKDTGIGIADQDRDKIFDEFYRTAGAARLKEAGTGLGLSICRGIVQAHGGRIWAESQLGHGSKFVFTLPNYQPIEKLSEYKFKS
jgi:signal transduction histidine kinase